MGNLLQQIEERERQQAAAIRDLIGPDVDRIAAAHDFGIGSAVKRGRNARFPYVPIIKYHWGNAQRTRQLRGLAYAHRDDAVRRAQAGIDAARRKLADDLCTPRNRALREQFGLPREPLLTQQTEKKGRP